MRRICCATAVILLGVMAAALAPSRASAQDAAADYVPLDADALQQLVAPVALYPDAVLAQVLVACSYPLDVVRAAQWVDAGNSADAIDAQNFDDSVKGVARYNDVLHYMAGHVDWMNDLGDAFINQQGDVMNAVQVLRAQANAAGNLPSNDCEQVVVDGDTIEIIPADPNAICIPLYDPVEVYLVHPHRIGDPFVPWIRFGPRIRVGVWMRHDIDWHDRTVYVGSWGADRPWWHHDGGPGNGGGRDAGARPRYVDNRPGNYRSMNVTNIRETNIRNTTVVNSTRWQRDGSKPPPKPVSGGADAATRTRVARGYVDPKAPARVPENSSGRAMVTPSDARSGSAASTASNRGRTSREAAGLKASNPTPPAGNTGSKPPERPFEPTPVRPTPTPTPTPSTPHPTPTPVRPTPTPTPSVVRPTPTPTPSVVRPTPTPAIRSGPARPSTPTAGGALGGYQNSADTARASSRGSASRAAAASSTSGSSGGGSSSGGHTGGNTNTNTNSNTNTSTDANTNRRGSR